VLAPILSLLTFAALSAPAQHATGLYDPQPPADSAYVRVITLKAPTPVDVWLDNKPRLRQVMVAQPSDYMVVTAGHHNLTLKAGSQSVLVPLDVLAGHSLTLALAHLGGDAKPLLLPDKANTNKLKAVIMAYHLDRSGPLTSSRLTAPKVFTALAPGHSASLVVNPVSIEFMVTRPRQTALARGPEHEPRRHLQPGVHDIDNGHGFSICQLWSDTPERAPIHPYPQHSIP
jgi:hypothetical protein